MFSFAVQERTKLLAATVLLRLYGLVKIPLVFYLQPSVIEWTADRCILRIPLKRRTKNQLGSMYFASLAAGADLAAGFFAMAAIRASGVVVSMVFKNLKADFLKRADGDVHFICEDGVLIADLIQKTLETGEREELPVTVTAIVPDKYGDTPVARFAMTLSVKKAPSVKAALSLKTLRARMAG